MDASKLREELQAKGTDFLGTPFSLTSYCEDPDNHSRYKVTGVIQQYGQPANIEISFTKADLQPTYWRITDEAVILPCEYFGTIELGKDVCVTDPCYARDVRCMTFLHNVLIGKWDVFISKGAIDSFGERVYVLELRNHMCSQSFLNSLNWEKQSDLGVDSGRMSVFDDRYYRRKSGSEELFNKDPAFQEAFDNLCRDLTLNEEQAGICCAGKKPVGIVCSSGIGDGCYPLEVKKSFGIIVAMQIRFL